MRLPIIFSLASLLLAVIVYVRADAFLTHLQSLTSVNESTRPGASADRSSNTDHSDTRAVTMLRIALAQYHELAALCGAEPPIDVSWALAPPRTERRAVAPVSALVPDCASIPARSLHACERLAS